MDVELKQFKQLLFKLASEDADKEVLEVFEKRFKGLFGHLDIIDEGANRIKKIVKGLSIFSHSDGDVLKVISINEHIESAVDLVKAKYKHSTTFDLQLDGHAEINCFPSRINQVLMNLLVNACQAIKSKQQKQSVASSNTATPLPSPNPSPLGKVTIIGKTIESQYLISISDNGDGISKDSLSKIFEPFYTTKEVGDGTGLGLALSYEIINQHKGTLEVETEVGVGTTFMVSLPFEGKSNLGNSSP